MLKSKFMAALAVTVALSTAVSGMGVSTFADESEPATVGSLSDGIESIRKISDVPGPSITPSPDRRSTGQIDRQDTTNADTKTNNTGNITDSDQKTVDAVPMYRLYNPNSGEHFYTASVSEKNNLAKIGWHYEGIGWYAPTSKNGIPVYRLYNKNGGEHHYTTSTTERRNLLNIGWKNEGIGWYSYEDTYSDAGLKKQSDAKRYPHSGAVSLYRQYNPNAYANNHNYTSNISENNYLISLGWRAEGIGWYGVKANGVQEEKTQPELRELEYKTIYTDFDLDGDGSADSFYFIREDEQVNSSLHLNNYPAQTFYSIRGWNLFYYRYNDANEFLIARCGQFDANTVDIYRWEDGAFKCVQKEVDFGDYTHKEPVSVSGKNVVFECSNWRTDTEATVTLTLNSTMHRFEKLS